MKRARWELDMLDVLIARLDPSDPGFMGDEKIREMFSGPARPYLQSWVLPYLREMRDGSNPVSRFSTRYYAKQDAAHVRRMRREAANR